MCTYKLKWAEEMKKFSALNLVDVKFPVVEQIILVSKFWTFIMIRCYKRKLTKTEGALYPFSFYLGHFLKKNLIKNERA